MRAVTLYTKPDCHLCEQALQALLEVNVELPFELIVRDITAEEALHRAYFERIPVVTLDGEELFEYYVDAEELRERLRGDGPRGPSRAASGSSSS
jgi:glutaredoxin